MVRVAIRDDKCTLAIVCSDEDIFKYHKWRRDQYPQLIGKTREELEAFVGDCTERVSAKGTTLYFVLSPITSYVVKMKDGKCVEEQVWFTDRNAAVF